MRIRMAIGVAVWSSLLTSCAALGQLGAVVQPPRFEAARDQPVEVQLVPPSGGSLLGGANIRLWTRISNPNPFGFTLASLTGTLLLDEARAATTDLPLGLPLGAGADTVVPVEFSISFADIPQLAGTIRRAAAHQPVEYRFEGTVGVDAGRLGTPVFGPMTFVRGTIAR